MKKEISIIEILLFINSYKKTISFFMISGLLISLLINNKKIYESEYRQDITLLLAIDYTDVSTQKNLPGFFSNNSYLESYKFFLNDTLNFEVKKCINNQDVLKKRKLNFYQNPKNLITVKLSSESIKDNEDCIKHLNSISQNFLKEITSEYSQNLSSFQKLLPKIIRTIDPNIDINKLTFEIDKHLHTTFLEYKLSQTINSFELVRVNLIQNNKIINAIFGGTLGFLFGIIFVIARQNLHNLIKLENKF